MTDISKLSLDGNVLKDTAGKPIAVINKDLPPDVAAIYANAFASSSEMLALLKEISNNAISDFQQQYNDTLEFNNQAIVPAMGPTARNIPELPDWLKEALILIARIDGDSDDR